MHNILSNVFFSPDNSASYRKLASQSSTASSAESADKAVDGDNKTCSKTVTMMNPWWQVDIGKEVNVSLIQVLNYNQKYLDFSWSVYRFWFERKFTVWERHNWKIIMYTTLEFPTHRFDFHLLTTSVNANSALGTSTNSPEVWGTFDH